MTSSKRLEPTDRTKRLLWGAAAGRCTLCNRSVLENEDLGIPVPIGELAHAVGAEDGSPRGASELSEEERRQPDNLLLLCRNCHKPIDDGGYLGLYSVETLYRLKKEHESRVKFLTGIGADRGATILRVVGAVRGVQPELSYRAVLDATTSAGFFPRPLPRSHRNELELDLRTLSGEGSPEYFASCAREVTALCERVNDGIRLDEINRLAVFGFARIPVLIHLGSRLDDKIDTLVFQRQRVDGENAWRWPEQPGPTPEFTITEVQSGPDASKVCLIANLSGSVSVEALPSAQRESAFIYCIAPVAPAATGPSLIDSPAALASFETTLRGFLAMVESTHAGLERIALFGALPLSAAIVVGRTLMPNVSPAWQVFDRDTAGSFFEALEVRR